MLWVSLLLINTPTNCMVMMYSYLHFQDKTIIAYCPDTISDLNQKNLSRQGLDKNTVYSMPFRQFNEASIKNKVYNYTWLYEKNEDPDYCWCLLLICRSWQCMKCLVGTCFKCQVSLLIKQQQYWRDTPLQPSKPGIFGVEWTLHLHSLLVVYVRPTPSVLVKVKEKACYLISELVSVKGEYIVEHTVELKNNIILICRVLYEGFWL